MAHSVSTSGPFLPSIVSFPLKQPILNTDVSIMLCSQIFLAARVVRNVDGLDQALYHQALRLRRRFESSDTVD
jgi:hypothetical protein